MSDLQRVLAALDAAYGWSVETGKGGRPSTEALHDAARVIRELAADFDEHADHVEGCDSLRTLMPIDCDCGLDAAREKWRLEP